MLLCNMEEGMLKLVWIVVFCAGSLALGHAILKLDANWNAVAPDEAIAMGKVLEKKWEESNRPGKKPGEWVLIQNKEVEAAQKALRSISSELPQYPEAKRLLASFEKQESIGKKAMEADIAQARANNVEGRKDYVNRLESNFLKAGMDVRLGLSGPKSTILSFRYALVSRPFLYKLTNETQLLKDAKQAGFIKIDFSDGYNTSASYDLLKDRWL